MNLKIITGRWDKRLRNYMLIGMGLILVSIIGGYTFYTLALDQVVLNVDGEHMEWKSLSPTVAGVLKEKGIIIKQGDVVKPSLITPVSESLVVDIIRAFPVKIKVGGEEKEFFTITQTVKDILNQAKINYDEDDIVRPGLNIVAKPNQSIRVINVTSTVITKQVVLNPPTEYRKDKKLERGVQKVVRAGASGLVQREVKIFYADGRESGRRIIAEKILKPAITAIIALGIKPVIRTLETTRGSYRYVEMKLMKATAYYPGPESCGKYAVYGVTYTGKKAGFGLVAVDPRVIPLGTKLYIEGYGKAEAADIGSAIKGNRIDLCYETFREAAMFGVKKIKVYILE